MPKANKAKQRAISISGHNQQYLYQGAIIHFPEKKYTAKKY